jgi:hypothetical protein
MGHREVREPLREDLATTVAGSAVEATRPQFNAAANALPGKIAEGSAILAVDMTRADTAKWTRGGISRCAGDHDNRTVGVAQTLHVKVCVFRKQYRQRAGGGSHLPMSLEDLT